MPGQELTQEDMDRANALVDEAMHYVFNEYDDDHDGLIARREFFAFLWKLKSDTGYTLNEGQMISCWSAMAGPDDKEKVNYTEFVSGLEKIYENYFYAIENGAPIPESQIKIPLTGEDASSYNTVRFKNSAAVAFFDMILQDEKNTHESVLKEREERARALAQPAPFVRRSSEMKVTSPSNDAPPSLEATPSANVSRNSSLASGADVSRKPSGLARPSFNAISQQDQERERKRKEAEEQLQKIMAERHKEERRKREEERLKKAEEARKANEQAANALLTEPAWKKAAKTSTRNP